MNLIPPALAYDILTLCQVQVDQRSSLSTGAAGALLVIFVVGLQEVVIGILSSIKLPSSFLEGLKERHSEPQPRRRRREECSA